MEINRTTDYAVRVVMHLASQAGGRVTSSDIARQQGIPLGYIPKVLQTLGRAGILSTSSGRSGGVRLRRPAGELSVLDVVQAMEGPVSLNRCLVREGECPRQKHCPVHDVWERAQQGLLKVLRSATIGSLLEGGCGGRECKRQQPRARHRPRRS